MEYFVSEGDDGRLHIVPSVDFLGTYCGENCLDNDEGEPPEDMRLMEAEEIVRHPDACRDCISQTKI